MRVNKPLRHLTRSTSAFARAAAALLCGLLLVSSGGGNRFQMTMVLLGLVLVGLAAMTVPGSSAAARLASLLEGALWGTGVLLGSTHPDPLLPYLVAPALAGGLALGVEGVALPVGVAAVSILAGAPTLDSTQDLGLLATRAGQWVGISLTVGLLASWVHRLQNDPRRSYTEAYELLSQLRTVTRTLPVGLDTAALADQALRDVQGRVPNLVAAGIYTRAAGTRPALRATAGAARVAWRVDLAEDSVFSDAWNGQVPAIRDRGGAASSITALPLVVANRTVGVVGLETRGPRLTREKLTELTDELEDAALRLESAMLFDELRELATVEERRRLAREIHDGIAQDLAAFGYVLDSLVKEARSGQPSDDLAESLLAVRTQLGGLVGELRTSIFELRTEVDAHGGLSAALAEYVRAVGAASHLTVHLSLNEHPERLPADVEAELLRIAQEAVTNARKHAQAENLWVSCTIDPPFALLVVEDDGVGPGAHREGSFGIEIMRERAERLRATLDIGVRSTGGTVVTCRVGAVDSLRS